MNILSFDIEEWFHILDKPDSNNQESWQRFPSRINENINRILRILDDRNLNATFFCLGWIGEKYPNIIKQIDRCGHEIGTHSHSHKLVYEQTPSEFNNDLKRSISVLSDITGKKINSYRAPGFSITENQKWAFEIMYKNGITIDCSIFPAQRSHGGFSEFNICKPTKIKLSSGFIKSYPMNTSSFLGINYVFSGGGYFRFIPYWVIKQLSNNTDYLMTYFHPRDFDIDQPIVPNLSYFRKFKSYYGLKNAEKKLHKYLDDFDFISLNQANNIIDWNKAQIVDFSK
tara:strand:+ start:32424 stop:33278 length:855 start_codon:yes stop_codon:yes gene_type:complete